MDLDALTNEVLAGCDVLARCSEARDRLTRTFLRPPMHEVHQHLGDWMRDAGLQVRVDAVGNLIGRRAARREDDRVFLVGSHVDTVPDAGKYDGVLGVLLGLAAVRALGNRPSLSLDLLAFSEEEGIRYRTPYLGSLAICGRLSPDLLERTDADGVSLAQALRDFGLDASQLPEAAYPPGQVAGYLEAHIEQGPVLEALDLPLGVVTAIVGQSRRWLHFLGQAGHAGTQPLEFRRDALAAAAEFVGAVERSGRAVPGLRATVGSLTVAPGAVNVVPGEVRLSLDVRHADDRVREQAVVDLLNQAGASAAARDVRLEIVAALDQPAVHCDPELTECLANAVAAAGHRPHRLVSGAGHDAVVLAGLCPAAMLFVRSPGGISHHPDERVRREDVRAALDVMIRFLEVHLCPEW
jgi:allantoate deiminase